MQAFHVHQADASPFYVSIFSPHSNDWAKTRNLNSKVVGQHEAIRPLSNVTLDGTCLTVLGPPPLNFPLTKAAFMEMTGESILHRRTFQEDGADTRGAFQPYCVCSLRKLGFVYRMNIMQLTASWTYCKRTMNRPCLTVAAWKNTENHLLISSV